MEDYGVREEKGQIRMRDGRMHIVQGVPVAFVGEEVFEAAERYYKSLEIESGKEELKKI